MKKSENREIYENFFEFKQIVEEAIKTDLIPEMKSYIRNMFKEEISEYTQTRLDIMSEDFENFTKRTQDKFDTALKKTNEHLEKILKSNENAEEYIANMLTAIRQNEYLQAWYPAQKGYPEMNVTGKHPSQTEKVKNGKKRAS